MSISDSKANFERIGIVGPGAIGLMHAIHMAQSGLPVTLLDHRKSRARRLSGGIALQKPATEGQAEVVRLQVPCRASHLVKEPFNLLIFTVKSQSTLKAVEGAKHLITPETVLVSLQNGLGNVETLQQHQQPELVLAAVTTSGATLHDEHTVVERGFGTITVGSPAGNMPLAEQVAALFAGAQLPAEAVEDIWPVVWRKLAVNCAVNPLTALLDVENGLLLDAPVRHLMGEVALEVGEVAKAVGIDIEPKALPRAVEEVCKLTGHNISSMLQDVRAGLNTEVDQLNGAVARAAEKVGMKAPLNMALAALVKAQLWRRERGEQERRRQVEERREQRRQKREPSSLENAS
ncbi:MAG: 2-dehydropantoate 2-reductase [Armatimonadia bacterium]